MSRAAALPVIAAGLALTVVGPGAAAAQDAPPMVTDRPDQTESAVVVAPGFVQIEAGGLHEVGSGGTDRVTGLGAVLGRIGVIRPIELRIGFLGWRRVSGDGTGSTSGFGDFTAGLKVGLHEGSGLVPSAAVLATLRVPVGDRQFRAGGVDPEIRAALAHDLGGDFSLGYNVGAAWVTESDAQGTEDTRAIGLYTVSLAHPIAGGVGAFVEGFGLIPFHDAGNAWHALDGGLTFAVMANVQLDMSVGVGLDRDATDWFLGLGISGRLPR